MKAEVKRAEGAETQMREARIARLTDPSSIRSSIPPSAVHPSNCPSICLSIHPPIRPFIHLSICHTSVHLSSIHHPSIWHLSIHPSIHPSVCLSIDLPVCPSVHSSIHLSFHLSEVRSQWQQTKQRAQSLLEDPAGGPRPGGICNPSHKKLALAEG